MPRHLAHPLLRPRRDGHEAKVTSEELFFDLVYVFAVTQLSHSLLKHLTPAGVFETVILWFAVWLAWQYICWFTNWFDPENPRVRTLLFALMLPALLMASALPDAFGDRALVFALGYLAIQFGNSGFVLANLRRDHQMTPNYQRMFVWHLITAVFWISGALAPPPIRAGLWICAVAITYATPMIGFALPGLGRSTTKEWVIDGGHLAERCQLFVIVALGETLLVTGATLAETPAWSPAVIAAFLTAFAGSLAMWWVYFAASSKDGSHVIAHAADPGRIGAHFGYVHVVMVAGIIGAAVGNELVLAHPGGRLTAAAAAAILGGPAIFLAGSGFYKRVVYSRFPASHLAGLMALAALVPATTMLTPLAANALTTLIVLAVGAFDARAKARLNL
jgi:low temperature requirement protein LtrA